jgi:hypothetical protein
LPAGATAVPGHRYSIPIGGTVLLYRGPVKDAGGYTRDMAGSPPTPARPKPILARAVAAALAAALAGCGLGEGRCLVESRSLQYEAETRSDSLLGRGVLELSETRGAENSDWVLWHVRVLPFAGRVTAVSLRQGPPQAPGRLLYRFPVVNSVPESGVITQVFVRTAYAGEVPFADLWDLVLREDVSFEAVFDDVRTLRVGPLLRTGFSDWQEVCT